MLFFVLGLIVGLLIAIIAFLSFNRFQVPIERTVKQVENKLRAKGEVFYETEDAKNLDEFLDNLKKE